MLKSNKLISAVLTVVLGLLFLVFKGEVIGWTITVFGIAIIAMGVLDILKKNLVPGIVRAAIGVLVILLGWLLLDIALIILGVVLIAYGVLQVLEILKEKGTKGSIVELLLQYAQPAINVIIGICLLFARGNLINVICIIVGIIFLLQGILALLDFLKKN
jgi:hypothetical protein